MREYAERIFFLLNKADYLSETDLQDAVAFARPAISEAVGREPFITPVSARMALEGKLTGSRDLLEKSLLPLFSTTLNKFLLEEKGEVLICSIARNLLRIVSQTRFRCELELASLQTPLADLKQKIMAFEEKKQEVMLAKEESGILLEGEAKRIIVKLIEPNLSLFKTELIRQVSAAAERYFTENKALPARKLSKAMEEVVRETREAFDTWRSIEDEKVAAQFENVCSKFTARINDTVDELFCFSSELFAIPFAAVQADSLWSAESGFYYKFWSEPGSLSQFTSSVIFALPRFISSRLILKRIMEHVQEVVDMQSGRVRYDFAGRLDKSVQGFRREMLRRIEATVEGIEAALQKGTSRQQAGEREFELRSKALHEIVERLDDVRKKITKVTVGAAP